MKDEILDEHQIHRTPGQTKLWKIAEIAGLTIGILGFVFKKMHWFGSLQLFIVGTGILAFLYSFALIRLINIKGNKSQTRYIKISGLILGFAVIIIVSRLLLWSVFDGFTIIGYPLVLVAGFYYFLTNQKPQWKLNNVLFFCTRFVVFGAIAIYFFHLPIRTQFQNSWELKNDDPLIDAFEDNYYAPNDTLKKQRYDRLRQQHWDSLNQIEFDKYTRKK